MNYVETIRKKIGHDDLILAGSNIIITDSSHRILLQKRTNGTWGLLGGLMEIGESLEETAIREVKEEAHVDIAKLKLLNVFSGPQYYFTLPNRDQIYVITALFHAQIISGELLADGIESLALNYFDLENLPENMEEEYKTYIQFYKNYIKENKSI
ncbi:MAG: NUDIX hydrolase [Beduini sp.]